jgi:hypothetical protein
MQNGIPVSDAAIVLADGRRPAWLSCRGNFGLFVFVQELPDIDWVPTAGKGVALDLPLPVSSQDELIRLMQELSTMGWGSGSARWTIQQSVANWHGIGGRSFVDAITRWADRYGDFDSVHHTEDFYYQDTCDGGHYTLMADVAASSMRSVRHCNLSLQLIGIPVYSEPIRHLCDTFGLEETVYFRPLTEKSVTRRRVQPSEQMPLNAVAFITEAEDALGDHAEWATGVVVENPYYDRGRFRPAAQVPEAWPAAVIGSELLVCDLRSYHPLKSPRNSYHLWGWEWTWTSDALVVRFIADWDDPPVKVKRARPLRRSRSTA